MAGKPKILLLHGFLSGPAAWATLRGMLEREGIEAVAPNLLGYGENHRSLDAYTLEAMIGELRGVVEREQPSHVVGHSMGGIIGLALAAEMPGAFGGVGVIGLPVFRDRQDGLAFLQQRGFIYRSFLRRDGVSHMVCRGMQRTAPAWLPFAPLVLPRQPRAVLRRTFDHCRAGHTGGLRIVFDGRVDELAHGVETPVYALHGARDRTAPLDRVQAAAQEHGWGLRVAPGAGHQLPVERPGIVVRWLHEWAVEPAPPAAPRRKWISMQ